MYKLEKYVKFPRVIDTGGACVEKQSSYILKEFKFIEPKQKDIGR